MGIRLERTSFKNFPQYEWVISIPPFPPEIVITDEELRDLVRQAVEAGAGESCTCDPDYTIE